MTPSQALAWIAGAAVVLVVLALTFVEPLRDRRRAKRRTPVTDSNRALRDRRANVVLNADAQTIAFALGQYDADLAGLQHWADRLAANARRAER